MGKDGENLVEYLSRRHHQSPHGMVNQQIDIHWIVIELVLGDHPAPETDTHAKPQDHCLPSLPAALILRDNLQCDDRSLYGIFSG